TALICLRGRSGSGKSALLDRFLAEVAGREDVLVLAGRCYELESVPYKALDSLIDLLTKALLRLPPGELAVLLPPGMAALSRVFPVLNRLGGTAGRFPVAPVTGLHELRQDAFAALRELLARLGARRPLVLAIDDLQWGDADSAAILSEVLAPVA